MSSGDLSVFNRQRRQALNRAALDNLLVALLEELVPDGDYDLAIHVVGAKAMAKLNETALRHAGSTDVITFDFAGRPKGPLTGEIYVCLEEAAVQAARFQTSWQDELARYLIHGLLHLRGHDDIRPAARRKMKRAEDRLLRAMRRRFDLRKLGGKSKVAT